MDNVLSVSRSRWRSVANFDRVSHVFDDFYLASSAPTAPTHVSAATKPVRVNAASSMAFTRRAWMAPAKSAKRASSVALTSARARLPTPTESRLLLVRTRDLISNARLSGYVSPAANDESEWPATDGTPQNTDGGQPPPPIQAMPHYPPPEGFYPYFYPPPPGFIPPGHEGQSPPDGATNATNHPPMVPYYPLAPPGFFPHYAAAVTPGAFPPPSHGTPVTTIVPAEGSRNTEADEHTNGTGKKRSRAGKSGKSKKHKAAATTQGSPTSGGAAGGSEHASDPGANSPPEHDD
jgi:hypothetical protein